MSFCSAHSNMHSKWSSTTWQLRSSNSRLRVAKIPMLTSKWTIWNHGSMHGWVVTQCMEKVKKKTNNDFERVGKNRVYKTWKNEFQLVAMEANTIASFFTITHGIQKDMDIDEPCTNPIEITFVVMECCLNEKSTPPSIPTILPSSSACVGGLRLQALVKKPKS